MNNYIKYGMVFGIVLIILYFINNMLSGNMDEQIKKYLLSSGYVMENNNENRYYKRVSSNTENHFNTATYSLTQKVEENDDIKASLNQTYNYTNHQLSYNYRVIYSNNINVIFKGTYIDNHFTCDKEFSTATLSTGEINNTCKLVELKVERFYKEAESFFSNYKLVKYMENVTIE